MDICLNVPARQQSPALESLDHDPRDFILFHQDRQQWARAALLFPADDFETLKFVRSLANREETSGLDEEVIETPMAMLVSLVV